ncbi:MAG: phosphotransferase, partial [Alphaproteobacteria bacterium]|nr:phosphotransferase [Alphaproteobacteria bacterium]
ENERLAIQSLPQQFRVFDGLYAGSARVLVWPDDKLRSANVYDEALLRATGFTLGCLHVLQSSSTTETEGASSWRTVNRIVARAQRNIDIPAIDHTPVHGDPCLENVLVDSNGNFVRFTDFEEFGLGDPRGDLALCLVEAVCSRAGSATETIEWIIKGYFSNYNSLQGVRFTYENPSFVRALVDATIEELNNWAKQNRQEDLAQRYHNKTAEIQSAFKDFTITKALSQTPLRP